jgi:hypothetical protein
MSKEKEKFCPIHAEWCWKDECEWWNEKETACVFWLILIELRGIRKLLKGEKNERGQEEKH